MAFEAWLERARGLEVDGLRLHEPESAVDREQVGAQVEHHDFQSPAALRAN